MRHIFTKLAMAMAAVFLLALPAAAQTILVVDQQRVMRDSEVGKHITTQLKSIGTQMDAEAKSTAQTIVSERDSLVSQLQGLTPESAAQRPDLKQRAETLMKKDQDHRVELAYKQRELLITEQKAVSKVNEALAPILEAIVKERGATIMVDRSMVMYAGPTVDVTDEVIRRLNSKMKTVSVVRERLPRKS